jgi:hypothetical protein
MGNLHMKMRVAPSIKTGETIQLVNGPSKYNLSRALFDAQAVNPQKVTLHTGDGIILMATVGTVEIEDGSGECFLLKGACYGLDNSRRPYEGFIRTDARKGWIKFLKD